MEPEGVIQDTPFEFEQSKMPPIEEGTVYLFGNPLVDRLYPRHGDALLIKYGLPADGEAELGAERHRQLLLDLAATPPLLHTAGGSALNSARVAQWVLGRDNPRVMTFVGCVGDDASGAFLRREATEAGVRFEGPVDPRAPTGNVVGLVSGHARCLAADTGASGAFDAEWLRSRPEHLRQLDRAKAVYFEGFFLFHSAIDTALFVARRTRELDQLLVLNLSSTYAVQAFCQQVAELYDYVDILIGNKEEMTAFFQWMRCQDRPFGPPEQQDVPEADCLDTYQQMEWLDRPRVQHPKARHPFWPSLLRTSRIIVATDGPEEVLVSAGGRRGVGHRVPEVPPERVADGVGCGDALVGGFLAAMVQDKSLEQAVAEGIRAAGLILQQPGCTVPQTPFHMG